jgi:hypothetical protein
MNTKPFFVDSNLKKIHDTGKPVERRGRKAMGLKASLFAYDRQAAESITHHRRITESLAAQFYLLNCKRLNLR